jgi:hypothetical protein
LEDLLAMANGGNTELSQILRRELRESLAINVVIAESLDILNEAQAPQPGGDVHCSSSASSS